MPTTVGRFASPCQPASASLGRPQACDKLAPRAWYLLMIRVLVSGCQQEFDGGSLQRKLLCASNRPVCSTAHADGGVFESVWPLNAAHRPDRADAPSTVRVLANRVVRPKAPIFEPWHARYTAQESLGQCPTLETMAGNATFPEAPVWWSKRMAHWAISSGVRTARSLWRYRSKPSPVLRAVVISCCLINIGCRVLAAECDSFCAASLLSNMTWEVSSWRELDESSTADRNCPYDSVVATNRVRRP